jgi:EmrB/QacA subfamily drug resistance transporter
MNLKRIDYKWLVAAAFVFGIFMDLMDITIVNVALPTLGRHFHTSSDSLEWVVTGYLLSLAIWIPASGWIGDQIGTKKVFLFALATFVLASALCGLSWNIGSLIAFRVLQGVGGGMMTPVGMTMLFRAFPPQERAKASIVIIIPTVIAPALGPVLGGAFVDYASWHWIFFVNLPIGIAGFLFTLFFVKEERQLRSERFDYQGFVLSGAGLALVLFALSRGPRDGWASLLVLAPGLIGLAMFAALVWIELRATAPMLNLRLLGDRMFRNANVVLFAAVGGLMGVVFLLPLLLQDLRGFSAIRTGLILMPQAVAVALVAPLVGALYPRFGPRRLLSFAMVLFTLSSALLLFVDLETSTFWIGAILVVRGIGMAFTFIPLQTATFATIKPDDTGQASSIFNTNRQVASSFGVALLATVLISRTNSHVANAVASAGSQATDAAMRHAALLGFHDAFFASVILAAVGVVFTFLIRDADAAATMVAPSEAWSEGAAAPVSSRLEFEPVAVEES